MKKRRIDTSALDRFKARMRTRNFVAPPEPIPGTRCELVNATADVTELFLYGEIDRDEVSAMAVASALRKANSKTIRVRLNSPGGSIFEGVAIYNLLAERSEKIEMWIDAIAASIASVVAMAGDEIVIAGNAQMMIHRAQGACMGTADDMGKLADILEQCEKQQLIPVYQARTKLSAPTLAKMMAAETWMGAQTAVDKGFADRVAPLNGAKAMVRRGTFAKLPAELRERMPMMNHAYRSPARQAMLGKSMRLDARRRFLNARFQNGLLAREEREELRRLTRLHLLEIQSSL